MSLRARKQSIVSRSNPGVVMEKEGNREYDKYPKEPGSPVALFGIIFVICLIAGYREYNRVQGPIARSPTGRNEQITIPLPHRELNPNFRSLLTPDEDQALEINAADNTRYHIIFSTDCSPFQHWQSYLVFFSAMTLRQPGHVTRIASGCEGKISNSCRTGSMATFRA
jgi:hypothetical protein